MPTQPLLGSELFAHSQGSTCNGDGRWRCHWCGGKCQNEFVHDDPPPIPFVRSKSTALCPFETYICYGCWLWRRPRVTVNFLAGGFQDRQAAKDHSWWITEEGAWALKNPEDYQEVYRRLIKPPKRFLLALRGEKEKLDTLIQLCIANDPGGITGETPLYYTLNNIRHTYSIYELTEAIKLGCETYGPGIRALWSFLGEPPDDLKKKHPAPKEEKRGQGERIQRDDPKKTIKKVVVASGA